MAVTRLYRKSNRFSYEQDINPCYWILRSNVNKRISPHKRMLYTMFLT